jgi:signal transduction histidine kinase
MEMSSVSDLEEPRVVSAEFDPARALQRIALALNSSLELREVLRVLGEITLEVTGACRCGIFLLEGDRLRPVVAIGRVPDERLWEAFRAMGPVDPATTPEAWNQLELGEVVTIRSAAGSSLIPPVWRTRFDLQSLALVPLLAEGQPCGMIGIDYQSHHTFRRHERELLDAVGRYAGAAVRNARLFESVRKQAALHGSIASAASTLVSTASLSRLTSRLADAYSSMLNVEFCVIGVLDDKRTWLRVLATRGTRRLREALAVEEIPERIKAALSERWLPDSFAIELDDDPWIADHFAPRKHRPHRYLLVPLLLGGKPRGGVLLGLRANAALDDDERAAAQTLAGIAAAAIERQGLLDSLGMQLRRTTILHRLAVALPGLPSAAALTSRLNELLTRDGIHILSLLFSDRETARRLHARSLKEGDVPAPARPGASALSDGSVILPMRLGHKRVGFMQVRTEGTSAADEPFLKSLAGGVAELATRRALTVAVEEAERERAVAAERQRIAEDLHESAGQTLVAIELLARQGAEEVPVDSPWHDRLRQFAELASRGKWEIDQTVRALAFFPAARVGLASSLRSLARSFQEDSSIEMMVDVIGRPRRLPLRVERALYRVAHEALSNAWRHSRCSIVRVEVAFSRDEIALSVTDNGVGLDCSMRHEARRSGIAIMRKAVEEVGGAFRIRNVKLHGVRVEARVARGVV